MLIETSKVCCAIKSGWSYQISRTEHKLKPKMKPKNEANKKVSQVLSTGNREEMQNVTSHPEFVRHSH